MNKFSPDHLELLARYYNMIVDEIARKQSPSYNCLPYISGELIHFENELIRFLKRANKDGLVTSSEAAVSSLAKNKKGDAHRLVCEYVMLMKILTFDEYSLIERDESYVGALRSKEGALMNSNEVFKTIDVCTKLTKALPCSALLIEWSYIQALCHVSNQNYIAKHIERCPLQLLIKIECLLSCFKNQFDARRFVSIKYQAFLDGEELKWTGRGVMPSIWRQIFDQYGNDRFKVEAECFSPTID